MRRYRTNVSHSLTESILQPTLLMWPWWVKMPTEDFCDETLAIDDTQGDDVIGGDWGAGHGGWQGGGWGDRHGSWQGDLIHDGKDNQWGLFLSDMVFMEMMLELVMDMEVDKVEVDWHGEDN